MTARDRALIESLRAIAEAAGSALRAIEAEPESSTAVEGVRQPDDDRLIEPREAAQRLGVTVNWLYRHHARLPFTRKLGRRTLRFSEVGLSKWLARKAA